MSLVALSSLAGIALVLCMYSEVMIGEIEQMPQMRRTLNQGRLPIDYVRALVYG